MKLFSIFGDIAIKGQKEVSQELDRIDAQAEETSGALDEYSSEADKAGDSTEKLANEASQAEPRVSSFGQTMSRVGDKVSGAGSAMTQFVSGPMAAAGAAIGALTYKGSDMASQIIRQAEVAGMTAEEFQKTTFAAKTLGIQQDKVSDIFKDAADKFGDFSANQAGPMKDFFENIAPQVGVTAEQFKKLNGKEALQLYVNSLEKANVSQGEMTFYMEAVANDATMLLPLLRDNGKEMKNLADEAENAGLVLGQETLDSLKNSEVTMAKFGTAMKVVVVQLANALMPVLKSLVPFLTGSLLPALKSFANWLGGLTKAFNALPGPIKKLVGILTVLVAGIGPVLWIGGKMVAMFGSMIATLPGLIAQFYAWAAASWAAMAPYLIWVGILAGLVATIYIVGRAIAFVIDQLGGWQGIWDKLTGALQAGLQLLKTAFQGFADFVRQTWGAIWSWIRQPAMAALAWLRTKFHAFTTFWVGIWKGLKDQAQTVWMSFWELFREPFLTAYKWLREKLTVLVAWWKQTWAQIKNLALGPIRQMWTWITQRTQQAYNMLTGTMQKVRQFFIQAWQSIYKNTVGVVQNMWSSVVGKVRSMANQVQDIISSLSMGLVGNSIIPDMANASVKEFEKMRRGAEEETGAMASNVMGKMQQVKGPSLEGTAAGGQGRGGGTTIIDQRHSVWRDDKDMLERVRRSGVEMAGVY